jgi:acetyltransferase-like isoleucine patch superfamily enzyme
VKKLQGLLLSIFDPRAFIHIFRIIHFYNYSHVKQVRLVSVGRGARLAPNASLRNGERITLGAYVHVGERVSLWAGNEAGRITLGEHAMIGPGSFVTASNYETMPDISIDSQPKQEADVVIGPDVWIGANSVVLPGVSIGEGTVVGAGSVVTKSLPAGVLAGGVPAKVIGKRGGSHASAAADLDGSDQTGASGRSSS